MSVEQSEATERSKKYFGQGRVGGSSTQCSTQMNHMLEEGHWAMRKAGDSIDRQGDGRVCQVKCENWGVQYCFTLCGWKDGGLRCHCQLVDRMECYHDQIDYRHWYGIETMILMMQNNNNNNNN